MSHTSARSIVLQSYPSRASAGTALKKIVDACASRILRRDQRREERSDQEDPDEHEADDGCAVDLQVVEEVSAGLKTPFIRVGERLDTLYNWSYLSRQQEELREEFGDQEAHPNPDYRPEFNE